MTEPAQRLPSVELGVECTNGRAERQLVWLRRTVGDDAIRDAVARLPGAQRPWPFNVARVLGVRIPSHLDLDPATPAAFFASAKALLGKKGRPP